VRPTERERELLRLLVRGHDIKSIARALSISTSAANKRPRRRRFLWSWRAPAIPFQLKFRTKDR
jgi:FixJ family two-component response regulator